MWSPPLSRPRPPCKLCLTEWKATNSSLLGRHLVPRSLLPNDVGVVMGSDYAPFLLWEKSKSEPTSPEPSCATSTSLLFSFTLSWIYLILYTRDPPLTLSHVEKHGLGPAYTTPLLPEKDSMAPQPIKLCLRKRFTYPLMNPLPL